MIPWLDSFKILASSIHQLYVYPTLPWIAMESRREPSIRPKGRKTVALFGLSYQFPGDASTAGSSPCLPLLFSFLKPLFSTAPNHPDHPTHPQFPQPSPLQSHPCLATMTLFSFSNGSPPPTVHLANSSSSFRSQPKATSLGPPFPALTLQSTPASTSGSTVLACRALTSRFCHLAQFWLISYLHNICLKKASFPTRL